jgi:hypothetical protein
VTAYAADPVSFAGTTPNKRTGTASSDSVPQGCLLLVINTTANVHNLDLGINATYRGVQVTNSTTAGLGKMRYAIAANASLYIRVPPDAGDANGQCSIAIDNTASDITYYVIGV